MIETSIKVHGTTYHPYLLEGSGWDRLELRFGRGWIAELTHESRWKESEYSGDEWRDSWVLRVGRRATQTTDDLPMRRLNSQHSYQRALLSLSADLSDWWNERALTVLPFSMCAFHRATIHCKEEFVQLRPNEEGPIGYWLPYVLRDLISEEKSEKLLLYVERQMHLCFQHGCSAPGNPYEYIVEGAHDDEHYYRRFCEEHSDRGDCGAEDHRRNYRKLDV